MRGPLVDAEHSVDILGAGRLVFDEDEAEGICWPMVGNAFLIRFRPLDEILAMAVRSLAVTISRRFMAPWTSLVNFDVTFGDPGASGRVRRFCSASLSVGPRMAAWSPSELSNLTCPACAPD